MKLIQELRRRNVFKVAVAYGVTTWLVLQLAHVAAEFLKMPDWVSKLVMLLLAVGFLPAMILTWFFELTPEGLTLEQDVARDAPAKRTGRKLDYVIVALLGVSLGFFVWKSRFEQQTAEFNEATTEAAEAVSEAENRFIADAFEHIDPNSIAVLPFVNHSADEADLYFTDGIHDDLVNQLSKIQALNVISRTSVMDYRDTSKNLRRIAAELGVASVLEGSVQRAGERLRINVQLIDTFTGESLWAEKYDRDFTTDNLFDIQSEIARAIADALKATLSESEIASVASVPTGSVAAYDLYLQARNREFEETREGYQAALEGFRKALEEDPEFALAWIGLARMYITNYWFYGGDAANREQARTAIDRARDLDSDLSELYMAEGFYWYWGHLDYERALYNLGRAIELTPGSYEAHMWRGFVSRRTGLWEQALDSMQRALELNPRVYVNWVELGLTYLYLHQYDQAREAFAAAAAISPGHPWIKEGLSRLALQESGDTDQAMRLTDGAQNSGDATFVTGFINARLYGGRLEETLEAVRNLPDAVEVQRQLITLREDWAAQILHFLGRETEARNAANAALFRLQGLRARLGDDFRLDLAEARLQAILGEDPETVRALVLKAAASQPEDTVDGIRVKLDIARIYAIAGLAAEAVDLLDSLLQPPSETSLITVRLDPAFDGIRGEEQFLELMERWQ